MYRTFCKNVWIALHPCGKLRCIYFTCVGDRDAALNRAAGECQTAGAAPDQLERYQNILDYTHDAIIAVDETGRISVTNQIAEQMLRPAPPSVCRSIDRGRTGKYTVNKCSEKRRSRDWTNDEHSWDARFYESSSHPGWEERSKALWQRFRISKHFRKLSGISVLSCMKKG